MRVLLPLSPVQYLLVRDVRYRSIGSTSKMCPKKRARAGSYRDCVAAGRASTPPRAPQNPLARLLATLRCLPQRGRAPKERPSRDVRPAAGQPGPDRHMAEVVQVSGSPPFNSERVRCLRPVLYITYRMLPLLYCSHLLPVISVGQGVGAQLEMGTRLKFLCHRLLSFPFCEM